MRLGTNAILTHRRGGRTTPAYKVDTTLPTVSSVAITGEQDGIQNSFLNAGDNVSVTATFSETVIVDNSSGNPTLTLVVGAVITGRRHIRQADNSTDAGVPVHDPGDRDIRR